MIKRVNFTGRRRIARKQVQIDIRDERPAVFDAKIDLDGTHMPSEAKVYLEAMCAGSPVVRRYDFGSVGAIIPAQDRRLIDVDLDHTFFALKIVDQTDHIGRILGIAENIRAQRSTGQSVPGSKGILPIIEFDGLGQQLWDLDFSTEDVCLRVNAGVPGLKDAARHDPLFYSTMYPAVIRQVLARATDDSEGGDDDEVSDRWPALWRQFGKNLHPDRAAAPDSKDPELHEWIEAVVSAFCSQHMLKDAFLRRFQHGTGEET